METIEFNVTEMGRDKLDKAIEICKKYAKQFASNPVRAQKYIDAQKGFENAKKKLLSTIEQAKEVDVTVMVDGKEMSFYDAYIKGKENTVTIKWIGDQLKLHTVKMVEPSKIDTTMDNVIYEKYDFVDATKNAALDIVNGKGLSNGLVKASILVGVSELVTKGITSYLVGTGALAESFGLVGLAKTLVANFPSYMSALGTGFSTLVGFSPLIAITGGVLVATKLIPRVKQAMDKNAKKLKDKAAGEVELDKLASETMNAGE